MKLSDKMDTNEFEIEIEGHSSIYKLMDQLAIPKNDVRLVLINGKKCKNNTVLKHGDYVKMFMIPIVGGG